MKLLVVDDSESDRRLITHYLKSVSDGGMPVEISEATSISEAIACVENEKPDLVLLDYHLADGTADDFFECLEGSGHKGYIEVAVMTGQDDPGKSRAVLSNGAIDYLTKEMVTATTLPVIIRNLVEKIQLKRQVEEHKRELEAFTHRVSHDLRGVLGNIGGAAHLLNGCDTLEEVKEIAEIMSSAVSQAGRITDGLYELSKVQGIDEKKLEKVAISEIVEDAMACSQQNGAKANLQVDCAHEISCLKQVFPQVFQNLLSNSMKFSGKDEVDVRISSSRNNGHIRIAYEDSGPGIPVEVKERLFDAFQSYHREGQEGLGLGMNIVKRIVDVHRGSISVSEPEVYKGAAFEITLPCE